MYPWEYMYPRLGTSDLEQESSILIRFAPTTYHTLFVYAISTDCVWRALKLHGSIQ